MDLSVQISHTSLVTRDFRNGFSISAQPIFRSALDSDGNRTRRVEQERKRDEPRLYYEVFAPKPFFQLYVSTLTSKSTNATLIA